MKKLKILSVSFNGKIFFVLIVAIGILIFRFLQVENTPKPPTGKEIEIIGMISSEPLILGQSQYFQLGQYRIRTKIFPKYHFGERLKVLGTPDNNLLISYPQIAKVGESQNLLSPIFSLRRLLILKAAQIWPSPESSLLTGVILGQDAIPSQFRQSLINTGTIHIVVVSGQNVAMLAGFATAVFSRFFKRKTVAISVIGVILFYTILTGFQPPTMRAAVMGTLTFLAKLVGREAWGFWSLGLAALLMLIFEPKLLFDISFQLSFAATFGILFAGSTFNKVFVNFPKVFRESLAITLSAWIFTAPLIGFYFAKFTPITPISNILVVPVVPFLMITGALAISVALLSIILGKILAIIPFVAASYFTFVVENLAKIPFATLTLPQINLFLAASFYSFIIGVILWSKRRFLAED